MKNFLVGLAVGLPLGMLLGDALRPEDRSEMAAHMRQIWMDARQRASAMASAAEERARRFTEQELRRMPGNAGRNLGDLLDQQASEAWRRAASTSEAAMERGSEAVLNRVTREELLAVYGIGPRLADRIMEARPYILDYDVVARGILNESTFEQLRRQLLDRYRKSA